MRHRPLSCCSTTGVLAATARGGRLSERRRRCRGTGSRVQGGPSLDCHGHAHRARMGSRGAGVRRREPGSYDVAFPPPPPPPPPPPEGELHRRRPRLCLRRGPLDAHGHRDRRPGAELDGDATLRRQLDARLPEDRADTAVLPKNGGRAAAIRWTQTRAARVGAVETVDGSSSARSRTSASRLEAKRSHGTGAPTGASSSSAVYVVRVASTNELGVVELDQPLTVRRTARRQRRGRTRGSST